MPNLCFVFADGMNRGELSFSGSLKNDEFFRRKEKNGYGHAAAEGRL
jgi:hypothetical protein